MKRIPLASFRLQNFKAVRDSGTIRFGPLTVFIGNNGSGKSSLVEGLESFRDIIVDGLDAAMLRWRGFEHVWNQAVRHELQHTDGHRVQHTHPMAFHVQLQANGYRVKAKQEINLGEGGRELFIQHERVIRQQRQAVERLTRDGYGEQTLVVGTSGKLRQASAKVKDGDSILRDGFGAALKRWQFLNLVPDAMGRPVSEPRAANPIPLARNGANIAEYLDEIRRLDVAAFNGIFEALQYVLPSARDLQPTPASELQRQFYLKMKEEEFEVPGWLLSTGTLRVLALLACLRHPDPPPLLVVEEIENGLDPRTLHLLVEEMRAAMEAGSTQIILTTHSPYLLDLLDLSHVVVVERVDGQPTFTRPDKDKLAQWAESFAPGRLYTMGRLTRGE